MPRQNADPRRSGLPYALQLRLSDVQYRGLALEAEGRDLSMAEVARQHIESALRRSKMTSGPHEGKTLLQALEDDPNLTGILDAPADE